MFVTQEPSHNPEWDKHKTWNVYNKAFSARWFSASKGGKFVSSHYLDRLNLKPSDVWIADSLKCRLKDKNGKNLFKETLAARHCNNYLLMEIAAINPDAIVTLGTLAAKRTLSALGVSDKKVRKVQAIKNLGKSKYKTEWPVIVSLHWAQRSVPRDKYMKKVMTAIFDLL
jgi:uracil-DNA glycosylase family 4